MYLLDFFSTIFSDLIEEPVLIVGVITVVSLFFVLPLKKIWLNYKETLSISQYLFAICICLAVILVISAVTIKIIYYPQGQYYNHGGPVGLFYLGIITVVSLIAGLGATSYYLKSSSRPKSVAK